MKDSPNKNLLLAGIATFLAIYALKRFQATSLNIRTQQGLTQNAEYLPAGSNTGYLESIPGNPGSWYNLPNGAAVIGNPGSVYETGGYTGSSPATYVQGGTGLNNIELNSMLYPVESVSALTAIV